ncbi:MAG: sulfur carrier protein ThiS [Actinomycetota bacterium]|nr:sulfur carrier protein ThiS [Actinomycetota bacterium]
MVVVVNGSDVVVAERATVADLLGQLGLTGRLIVVERNGQPVPRREVAETPLHAGDRLELVRAVAGG